MLIFLIGRKETPFHSHCAGVCVCAFVSQKDKYAIQLGIATQWNEVSIQAQHTIPLANQLNGMEQSVLFHFAIKTHVAHSVDMRSERKAEKKQKEQYDTQHFYEWEREKNGKTLEKHAFRI